MNKPFDTDHLPAPLDREAYSLLQSGIWESEDVSVYVNETGDFAFLYPVPTMDYQNYVPRSQSLNLKAYKSNLGEIERRYKKIEPFLAGVSTVLEIGASNGSFLAELKKNRPDIAVSCVEPDLNTKPMRDALEYLRQYDDIKAVIDEGVRFDAVILFHVFEHFDRPETFLAEVKKLLTPQGRMIIEVPSLDDPILSLYDNASYQKFYFQKQHPFVYSQKSIAKVLEHNGWSVEDIVPFQRYGLENHLGWLSHGKPGGDAAFRELFGGLEDDYRQKIEEGGKTDSVLVVTKIKVD